MKFLILLVVLNFSVYGLNRIELNALDTLNKRLDRNVLKERNVKGFLFGRMMAQQTPIEMMPLIPPEELFKDTVRTPETPSSVLALPNQYISTREYDKDYSVMQKRLDDIEQTQIQLIALLGKQQSVQESRSDGLYKNQEFILKMIETVCGLLTIIGVLIGAVKAKDLSKGKIKPSVLTGNKT